MFKYKTGVATSIAAGMFITFGGLTAVAQQTTTSQSGSSDPQSSNSTQQSGSASQQNQTGSQQSGSAGQQSQSSGAQSGTSGTQSGAGSSQQSGTSGGNTSSGQQSGSMSQGAARSTSGSAAGAVSNNDRKFMTEAAHGGLGEVAMAQVALQKASSDSVKQYAQKMVDDHTKANDELKQIAQSKGVTLPTAPDPKRQKVLDRLQGLSGAEFDRAYMREAGNKDHENQAKLFRRQAERGADPEVKGFAAKTLPVVEEHLKMAKDMSGQMSGGSMNMSGSGGSMNQGSGSGTGSGSGSGSQGSGSGSGTTTPRP